MVIQQMGGAVHELSRINEIYTESVNKKFLTADRTPMNLSERRKWFYSVDPGEYPVFLAREKSEIIGWLAVRPYREAREALRSAKEVCFYLAHANLGKGIGTALLQHTLDHISNPPTRNLIAIVLEKNLASIGLLEKFGFKRWGFLPQIAEIDGEFCGQIYFGLPLNLQNRRQTLT